MSTDLPVLNPLIPKIHTQILQTGPYTFRSIKNKLREFHKRSKHFPLGDHFTHSHNLFSWLCIDNVKEKIDVGHSWDLKG